MNSSLENSLRKAMLVLGHAVETVIGKAKEAKVQVGTRGGMQPIMAVESLLTQARIKDIVESITGSALDAKVPDLKDKTALEIGEGPASFTSKLYAHQAKFSVFVEIGGTLASRQGDVSRGFIVRAKPFSIPLRENSFSYVVARLASPLQGDLAKVFREIGRLLPSGGQGVLVDYHPFGLYTKRGQGRLRPAESNIKCFEDYYRMSRDSGLRVIDVREAFVDENLRRFFREEEIQAYRHLKGTPLVVFIFFYKPKMK